MYTSGYTQGKYIMKLIKLQYVCISDPTIKSKWIMCHKKFVKYTFLLINNYNSITRVSILLVLVKLMIYHIRIVFIFDIKI